MGRNRAMRNRRLKVSGCSIILLVFASVLRADTIFLADTTKLSRITITDFKDAKLEYITTDGKRRMIGYHKVAILRLDGKPVLNRAERLFFLKKYDSSADEYQRIVNNAKDSWILVWSKVRLLTIFSMQKNIKRFVQLYADLANRIPDWVVSVVPIQNLHGLSSSDRTLLGRLLMSTRKRMKSIRARRAIERLYKRLGFKQELPPAPRAGKLQFDPAKMDQPGPWMDVWAEKTFKEGNVKTVLDIIEKLYPNSYRRNLPILLYWKGRALLIEKRYDLAGLTLIRIPIEFPSSRYTPFALYYAGISAELAGKPDYAKKIFTKLINDFINSPDFNVINIVEKAKAKLKLQEK